MSISSKVSRTADPRAERADLLAFLQAQRRSVLAIIEGLDHSTIRQSAVPSGWTPLGMIEHLAHAERFWFQQVLTGQADPLPWPPERDHPDAAAFVSSHEPDRVLAFYRDQCHRSDTVLALPHSAQHQRGTCRPTWQKRSTASAVSFCTSSRRPHGMPDTSISHVNSSTDAPTWVHDDPGLWLAQPRATFSTSSPPSVPSQEIVRRRRLIWLAGRAAGLRSAHAGHLVAGGSHTPAAVQVC